jgi:Sap-like sulfolipid-1-addressing protein
MNRDLATVLFSAVVATVNPSLLAAVAVMLLLPHPKRLMLAYLFGAYTTSVVSGLVIVFSLHGSGAVKTSSQLLSPSADIAIGAIALFAACALATGRITALHERRLRRKLAKTRGMPQKEPWQNRMFERGSVVLTFVVGAVMSFPGVSYVNALDHIAHLDPPTPSVLLLIAYFCVMQQILLEGALLASLFAGEWTQAAIVRFKAWLTGHGRQIATIGLWGMGMLLAARGLLTIS